MTLEEAIKKINSQMEYVNGTNWRTRGEFHPLTTAMNIVLSAAEKQANEPEECWNCGMPLWNRRTDNG